MKVINIQVCCVFPVERMRTNRPYVRVICTVWINQCLLVRTCHVDVYARLSRHKLDLGSMCWSALRSKVSRGWLGVIAGRRREPGGQGWGGENGQSWGEMRLAAGYVRSTSGILDAAWHDISMLAYSQQPTTDSLRRYGNIPIFRSSNFYYCYEYSSHYLYWFFNIMWYTELK